LGAVKVATYAATAAAAERDWQYGRLPEHLRPVTFQPKAAARPRLSGSHLSPPQGAVGDSGPRAEQVTSRDEEQQS